MIKLGLFRIGWFLFLFGGILQVGCGGRDRSLDKNSNSQSGSDSSKSRNSSEPHGEAPFATPSVSENPLPEESASRPDAETLGLRVIAESATGGDSERPDPGVNLQLRTQLDSASYEGNTILLHRQMFLRDPRSSNSEHHRRLFFVWPEDSFGSQIQTATYSHQVYDRNHTELGSLQSFSAWHDVENHRWFIPLHILFQNRERYREMDVSASDTQLLVLELVPERGPAKIIRIQFHAVGPFPQMQVISQNLDNSNRVPVSEWIRLVSNDGGVIQRDLIRNPSSRKFSIWLRNHPRQRSAIRLKTYLQESYFQERSDAQPSGPHWRPYRSEAVFAEKNITAIHEQGVAETLTLQNSEWLRVPLLPRENLILEWRVKPASSVVNCSLPRPQTRNFFWSTFPLQEHVNRRFPGIRLVPSPELMMSHSEVRTLNWRFSAGEIVGQWMREIRLTHAFTQEQDATPNEDTLGSGDFTTLLENQIEANFRVGDSFNATQSFECQGIFR